MKYIAASASSLWKIYWVTISLLSKFWQQATSACISLKEIAMKNSYSELFVVRASYKLLVARTEKQALPNVFQCCQIAWKGLFIQYLVSWETPSEISVCLSFAEVYLSYEGRNEHQPPYIDLKVTCIKRCTFDKLTMCSTRVEHRCNNLSAGMCSFGRIIET